MAKVLKIEPKSKDGLIKNLSEAFEHARKGEIANLSIIYERKYKKSDPDGGIRNYNYGDSKSINLLIDIAKHDVIMDFPTLYKESFSKDE